MLKTFLLLYLKGKRNSNLHRLRYFGDLVQHFAKLIQLSPQIRLDLIFKDLVIKNAHATQVGEYAPPLLCIDGAR